MKRRILALLICLLLLFQLSVPPARAADRVYFTAVGSYVLPLSDNTMPFWTGGYVYIASSIFTGAARESLGISQVYNNDESRLVLYSGGRSLTFTLNENCALDSDGNAYYPGAVRRNGTVFVPASPVSRYFDLAYSVIEVEQGSMVWLRQQNYNVSDKLYADAAQYQLNTVYADYIRAKETVPPKVTTPAAPVQPPSNSTEENPTAELDGKRIALCLPAGSTASLFLDALESGGVEAALFFTPEEIAEQGETLRRAAASGQNVGILADAADPDRTVAQQLEAGNTALFQAACCKTRLAYIQNAGPQAVQTAQELGFRCLRPDIDRSGQTMRSAPGAAALIQRLASRRGDAVVWLGGDVSPVGLRAFLAASKEAGGICAAYNETGIH